MTAKARSRIRVESRGHSSGRSSAESGAVKAYSYFPVDTPTPKFWILIGLEVICVAGLLSFLRSIVRAEVVTLQELTDSFQKMAVYAFMFVGLQLFFIAFTRPILLAGFRSVKLHGDKLTHRADRAAIALFKLTYNIFIFYGWHQLLDPNSANVNTKWSLALPDVRTLLSGDPKDGGLAMQFAVSKRILQDDVWSSNDEVDESLKSFFILIVGYLCSELLLLLPEYKNRTDFLEMLIHHTISVGLTFTSQLCGFTKIACLIMYVHNASDVFIYISRSTIDLPFKTLIGGCFFALGPYDVSVDDAEARARTAWLYFNSTLSILYTLNGYWWLLIMRVGLNFFQTGRTRDVGSGVAGNGVRSLQSLASDKGSVSEGDAIHLSRSLRRRNSTSTKSEHLVEGVSKGGGPGGQKKTRTNNKNNSSLGGGTTASGSTSPTSSHAEDAANILRQRQS